MDTNYDLKETAADNQIKPTILTPLPNHVVNTTDTISRSGMSRLTDIQLGEICGNDIIGTAAKDTVGLGRLAKASLNPTVNTMVMTSGDPDNDINAADVNTHYPFVNNPYPKLQPLAQVLEAASGSNPGKFGPRLLSHHAAAAPGCFVHQTVDSNGAMWHLDQLGTKTAGQAASGTHGANTHGVSSWRPVNMMNLSATQNPNTDLHITYERGQDTDELVTTEDPDKYIDREGMTTNQATSTVTDGATTATYDNQKVVYKDTQRQCLATRTEDTDARLLLPNYANEWVKLWREDLYDELNKTSNKNSKRPFGSAVNSDQTRLKHVSVFDQVGDKWLKAGERPTGRSFSEKYRQRKKTRVMVEPRSIVTYQFFADPGIEGDSRLLKSDLVKENAYGLIHKSSTVDGTVATDINTVLNYPDEEFHDKVLNQHEFFDQRSRCCMVFVNGAPHMIDGKHTTAPASINYTIKTLEKVAYVPKFYNKMQRLTHAVPYPMTGSKRYFDSDFVDKEGNAHVDATNAAWARAHTTPAQHASLRVQESIGISSGGGTDLYEDMLAEGKITNLYSGQEVSGPLGGDWSVANVRKNVRAIKHDLDEVFGVAEDTYDLARTFVTGATALFAAAGLMKMPAGANIARTQYY